MDIFSADGGKKENRSAAARRAGLNSCTPLKCCAFYFFMFVWDLVFVSEIGMISA